MLQISSEPIIYANSASQQAVIGTPTPLLDQQAAADVSGSRFEPPKQETQSSEPLSWTFLEQVSSLDTQLRFDVEAHDEADQAATALLTRDNNSAATTAVNGAWQSVAAAAAAASASASALKDAKDKASDSRSKQSFRPTQTIYCNGFALTSTAQLNVEILSQQIAVAAAAATAAATPIALEEALEALDAPSPTKQPGNFQFTTPTSTFRRKKQQQQAKQQQEEEKQRQEQLRKSQEELEEAAQQQQPAKQRSAGNNNASLQQQKQQQKQQPRRATMLAGAGSAGGNNLTISRQQTHKLGIGLMTASGSNNNGASNTESATAAGGAGGGAGAAGGGGAAHSGHVATAGAANTTTSTTTTAEGRGRRGRSAMASGASGLDGAGVGGFVDGIETYLGLIGWRKKCLYTLLLLLMLLIITNLVLTLWILKVMEFSTDGMGQLKIVPGGIQLSGQAIIMDMLRASTIRSRHGQPIAIESSRNFSINTRDPNGMLENHLFLGHDKFECLSAGFHINDTNGRNLFSVNRNEVTIGAHALRIDGEGGAIFRESIQTPHVRAEPGRELRLESPTRELELTAAKDINLQSRAGGIELLALEDVKLRALDGSLRLESSKILMPNLRTAQPPMLGSPQSRDHLHRVFQLCACSNGKLFLAAPHSICAGDDSTVCR